MRNYLLVFFLLIAWTVRAQNNIPPPPPPVEKQNPKDTSVIFNKVEIEASFPGGDYAWRKYLESNFRVEPVSDIIWKELPAKAKKSKTVLQFTAIVQFIVCKDGSLCEIQTINEVPAAFKAEAERLIAESKLWEPAVQDGRKVKAYRKQPITLQIPIE